MVTSRGERTSIQSMSLARYWFDENAAARARRNLARDGSVVTLAASRSRRDAFASFAR